VIGGEPFIITIAPNGHSAASVVAPQSKSTLSNTPDGLTRLTLEAPENTEVKWSIIWKK